MTLLAELQNKQILVLGAGLTGISCIRFLHGQGLSFAVNDSRINPFSHDGYSISQFKINFPKARLVCGQWCRKTIANADVIVASPGIDLSKTGITKFIKADCQIIGDVELFCQLNNARVKPMPMLAVTGSNGKSTVVSLLAYLAKNLGVDAQLGGNIGRPVLDLLPPEQAQNKLLILELSSFQLETLKSMRALSASVLNISDDHLDRHQTMANYLSIKHQIYKQAKIAVVNRDDQATTSRLARQEVVSFGSDAPGSGQFGIATLAGIHYLMFGQQTLIPVENLPLAGMHNALNYLAALALGYSVGWSLTEMIACLDGFSGLEHRCQRIESPDGICWINDSKATNVGATLAAIDGLSQTKKTTAKLILIAGGEGKGADFSVLSALLNRDVSHLITFGKDGGEIAKLVNKAIEVDSLLAAVNRAGRLANRGDIVLLSPACASIDMFENYAERGNEFMRHVQALSGGQ